MAEKSQGIREACLDTPDCTHTAAIEEHACGQLYATTSFSGLAISRYAWQPSIRRSLSSSTRYTDSHSTSS